MKCFQDGKEELYLAHVEVEKGRGGGGSFYEGRGGREYGHSRGR